MKVIATTRTRNEEANIERFCRAYGTFCDEIIIADGGSEDRTVELAKSMPKTSVYHFEKRVWNSTKTHWRNPHGEHINFCTYLAIAHGADWIIFDDCDSVPNITLQKNARSYFGVDVDTLWLYRLYILGQDMRLKKMEVCRQTWAWKSSFNWRAKEDDPWKHEIDIPEKYTKGEIDYPDVLLHYFAPDKETIKKKGEFYRKSGEISGHVDPDDPRSIYFPPEKAPEWAVWK